MVGAVAVADQDFTTSAVGIADLAVHWFLPRGILIVEGLQGLADVSPTGLLVALPLRLAGGSGSPVRVLLLHRSP